MKAVVPVGMAVLFGAVLVVGLGVLAVGLAYAYGVPGLIVLGVLCAAVALVAVRAVRRRGAAGTSTN